MNISKSDIICKTNYGLNIYAYILQEFHPNEVVLSLSGKFCKPVKNPFTDSEDATLIIQNIDNIFMFTDIANPAYKGDPFDFAELYFKLSGDELLFKLAECLNICNNSKYGFYGNSNIKKEIKTIIPLKPVINIPVCSFFKKPVTNTIPTKDELLTSIYSRIKGETYKQITSQLRLINDKSESRKFKAQNFDYVTFSGTFSKRSDDSLIKHTNLITIDFDHVSNTNKLKSDLLNDKYFETELLFTSPSGDGLKWVIPSDIANYTHASFFDAVKNYIWSTYHLQIDKSGSDISRACFLPHDNSIFINPKYNSYV